MVAGASSCTCSECGVVCPGRFSSCRDVWVRGPQQLTVVSAPAVPGQTTANRMAQNGTRKNGAGDVAPAEPASVPGPVPETAGAVAAGQLAVRVENRLAQLESRLGALEALAAYVQALRGSLKTELARLAGELSNGDGGETDQRLKALESRTASLSTIPARIDSLSREVFEVRRGGEQKERLDSLESRMRDLAALSARVSTLEEASTPQRPSDPPATVVPPVPPSPAQPSQ